MTSLCRTSWTSRRRRNSLRGVCLPGSIEAGPNRSDSNPNWLTGPDVFAEPRRPLDSSTWNVTAVSLPLPDGRLVAAHLVVVSDPASLSVVPARGSAMDRDGVFHCKVQSPIAAALEHRCEVATNAGFFDMSTGLVEGTYVHNGELLHMRTDPPRAAFGIDARGNIVIGYVSEEALRKQGGGFRELVTGKCWLARNSANVVDESVRTERIEPEFVTQRAPRTGVGVDESGRVLLLQVDGREDTKLGPTLSEFADMMLHLGAVSAVNLDGGGSSVTVVRGQMVSEPTCADTGQICVRDVPTILCLAERGVT